MKESDLRAMMRDPRYWRDRDPAFINEVTNGFSRLYAAEHAAPSGRWVPNSEAHPSTNIAGRKFRRPDGSTGVFYPGMSIKDVEWWFPDETRDADIAAAPTPAMRALSVAYAYVPRGGKADQICRKALGMTPIEVDPNERETEAVAREEATAPPANWRETIARAVDDIADAADTHTLAPSRRARIAAGLVPLKLMIGK